MKFRQTHRLILSFPQIAARQIIRQKRRVIENLIPDPSKWPRERVKDPTEKAGKLHVVVDVIHTLLLITYSSKPAVTAALSRRSTPSRYLARY
jgi:hypothetical protein